MQYVIPFHACIYACIKEYGLHDADLQKAS